MAGDPITGGEEAITEIAKLIGTMSAMQHPLLYMWRIHGLTNKLVKECQKNKAIVPADIVGAYCHDLDSQEQGFILHLTIEKLTPIK